MELQFVAFESDMYKITLAVVTALLISLSAFASADLTESKSLPDVSAVQGYGAFTHLNKDWMLMALYTASNESSESSHGSLVQRLEIKITAEKFTERRFRSLWLETLAIEHGANRVAEIESDLQNFFGVLQGPLIVGDIIVIERTPTGADLRINYHKLGIVSEAFLPILVESLVGKYPPSQALKSSLLGRDNVRHQMNLSSRFDQLEPTLPRIAEVSKWGRGLFIH